MNSTSGCIGRGLMAPPLFTNGAGYAAGLD